MKKKKRLLPFGWLPGHWGVTGKMRQVMKAEYELDGEILERQLLDINLNNESDEVRSLKKFELDLRYKHITEQEYDEKVLTFHSPKMPEKELKVAQLNIQKKYNKLSEEQYNKEKASILEEPYVRVAEIKTDPANPAFGGIILDWNEAFVKYLEEHGYGPHPDPASTVEHWFNDVCKNIALDAFDGIGDTSERLATKGKSDVIYHKDLVKPDSENK